MSVRIRVHVRMSEPFSGRGLTMTDANSLNRRSFLIGSGAAGLGALSLAGCMTTDDGRGEWQALYGPVADPKFPIPAADISKVDTKYLRRRVKYDTKEAPGTIIVDPGNYFVYRIEGDGEATRYGANVGRQGFLWHGDAYVGRKAEWPIWTPWAGGMPGGPKNPLGARALYLYQGNRDTLYRIHGTFAPSSIGKAVSSGCIRMINADVADLYDRVRLGAQVVVVQSTPRTLADAPAVRMRRTLDEIFE